MAMDWRSALGIIASGLHLDRRPDAPRGSPVLRTKCVATGSDVRTRARSTRPLPESIKGGKVDRFQTGKACRKIRNPLIVMAALRGGHPG